MIALPAGATHRRMSAIFAGGSADITRRDDDLHGAYAARRVIRAYHKYIMLLPFLTAHEEHDKRAADIPAHRRQSLIARIEAVYTPINATFIAAVFVAAIEYRVTR